jgi:Mlc titration factor MtfA (ptsG expression regulator)
LTGESWTQGQVILSWQDTLAGAANPGDGHNVVVHEFAHQLDQADGFANGAPPDRAPDLHGAQAEQATWSAVFQRAYAQLQREADLGLPSLLNPYGAKDPAEFFAVASEVFFEQPQALSAEFAELYDKLCGYYRVNPLLW